MSSILSGLLKPEDSNTAKYETLKYFYTFDEKKPLNVELITDLNNEEIELFDLLDFTQDYIKNNWNIDLGLDKQVKRRERRLISRNRKSRGEMTEVLKGGEFGSVGETSPQQNKGIMKRLFGWM